MRLLITDAMYPNRYASWRNVMIEHLVREAGADVLVFKTPLLKQLATYDFGFCSRDGLLDGYREIREPYFPHDTYALCRGRFGGYDAVYHIFASCFFAFQKFFPGTPPLRQFVHLYPGGGYSFGRLAFPAGTKIIATHPETTTLYQVDYELIECLMGPKVSAASDIACRDFCCKPELTVCFASLGSGSTKGDLVYLAIADAYAERFPKDRVRFVSIGNCTRHPRVTHHPPMDYRALGDFYRREVDIYVSPETGLVANGWPLGLEAAVTGCVVLTTDTRNTAARMDLPEPSILTCRDVDGFVAAIRRLYADREYASLCSRNTQSLLLRHVAPAAQQERILDFIRGTACAS
jgi:hypothetical protein